MTSTGSPDVIKITNRYTVGLYQGENHRWYWRVWLRELDKRGEIARNHDGSPIEEKHGGDEVTEDDARAKVKALVPEWV